MGEWLCSSEIHLGERRLWSQLFLCTPWYTETYTHLGKTAWALFECGLYYSVMAFARKNWPRKGTVRTVSTTSVNIGWFCYLHQWGMSNCSHSAWSLTHLWNNEFSSELPWSVCERDWCLESHSLTGFSFTVFEIPAVVFSETCSSLILGTGKHTLSKKW